MNFRLRSLFDSFYTRLILRDFFGKIVPGFIFLSSICLPFILLLDIDTIKIHDFLFLMPFWIWLFIIGLSWIICFAFQGVGEIIKLIRYYPEEDKIKQNPWFQQYTRQLKSNSKKDTYHFQLLCDFNDATRDDPTAWLQNERHVIIKEACGNTFLAFFFGLLIVTITLITWKNLQEIIPYLWDKYTIIIFIVSFLVIFGLWVMHKIQVDIQFYYMTTVIMRHHSDKNCG